MEKAALALNDFVRDETKPSSAPLWEFADIGFDPDKRLWFVNFFDYAGKIVGSYTAKKIVVNNGLGAQYQWKDSTGKWHVRERIYANGFDGLKVDANNVVTINYNSADNLTEELPSTFAYLQYAYHLTSNEENRAPTGFLELCNESGEVMKRINNKWIIVENTKRETIGEFPSIRLKVEKKDIRTITVTESCVVIAGPT